MSRASATLVAVDAAAEALSAGPLLSGPVRSHVDVMHVHGEAMIHRDVYDRLLRSVVEPVPLPGSMCLFPTAVGGRWNRGLVVCGRAVNGYDPTWDSDRASTPESRDALLVEISAQHLSSPCSMLWVSEWWGKSEAPYNTARSAFWRATRSIAESLGFISTAEATWPSHLAWMNLYRIAPASGGNPDAALCRRQLDACQELFTAELERLQPSFLLLMTGSDWAHPFVREMDLQWRSPSEHALGSGKIRLSTGNECRVLVCKHPQGKPHDQFVRSTVDLARLIA